MSVARMEPMVPLENNDLTDLATDLVAQASGLASRMTPPLREAVGDLVRSMNCYYSNLIEDHNTTLISIDRALKTISSRSRRSATFSLRRRRISPADDRSR